MFMKIVKELWEYVKLIIIVLVAVFILNHFVIINARIPSPSMENTIMTGDPERYDIVIFEWPDDPEQLFIKRVIGLPGETVEIRDGKVYIDGSSEPLRDDFIPEEMEGDFGPYTVPEDCYFMLGDNRNHSKDSRYWVNTYVEKDAILGKAVLRYFPLNKIGFLK